MLWSKVTRAEPKILTDLWKRFKKSNPAINSERIFIMVQLDTSRVVPFLNKCSTSSAGMQISRPCEVKHTTSLCLGCWSELFFCFLNKGIVFVCTFDVISYKLLVIS